MPLYEYECQECGERSEVIQGFSDRPLRKCPLCGGRVKKLVSAPAIQFKGTGWYVTDYAGKDKSAKGDASSKAADGGAEKKGKSDKSSAKDSPSGSKSASDSKKTTKSSDS